ncbi:MAG: ATP-dependent DNA helicase RecG [bacterium]
MQLATPITSISRLTDDQKKALGRLGLHTVEDLLYHFPARYTDITDIKHVSNTEDGERVTLLGKIHGLKTKKTFKTKTAMAEGVFEDISGTIKVVWFHQPYLAKMIKDDTIVKISGIITVHEQYGKSIQNPEIEKLDTLPIDISDSLFANTDTQLSSFGYPVYSETRGITSKWMYHTIQKLFNQNILDSIEEYIPEHILKMYSLPDIKKALVWIHSPQKKEHAEAARKRFAFEEIFLIQLIRLQDKARFAQEKTYTIENTKVLIKEFTDKLPFPLTDGQNNAIKTIAEDLEKEHPMARLVEGDVGSGKTLVAAAAAYAVVHNRPTSNKTQKVQTFGNLQVAYMAPTEILATQQFESFIEYIRPTGLSVALITSSGCKKFPSKVASNTKGWTEISKTQLSKWIANGEIPVIIGTHSLIQKSVKFKHLALAIVDEQHRFGTKQRQALARKESDNKIHAPHFLSMTATPIPRTLALTLYGDLDLSIIDAMPPGRKPVETKIISPNAREKMYAEVRRELEAGRQVYIICPRINEPDPELEIKLQLKSVETEAKRLKKDIFPKYEIDVLHSKMKKEEKDETMKAFARKEIDILVATSVVEVGVNVPNATVIIIEGAERFGLSQLHQLRGRVIRGTHQPYCFLVPDTKSDKTKDRLNALVNAKNGFELAELDLSLRGAGELSGFKQWGVSDLAMDAIKNIKLVEIARNEAKKIIEKDLDLITFPLLAQKAQAKNVLLHFE